MNVVSLRVEAGISFFYGKYLVDEAIKFSLKKKSKIKNRRKIKTSTLFEILFSGTKKREMFLSSLTSK